MPGIAAERLDEQWIPRDQNLWEIDRFLDFLAARRRLLVDELNDLLGLAPFEPGAKQREEDEAPADDAELYDGPEPGEI
jgi:hypothetical protein